MSEKESKITFSYLIMYLIDTALFLLFLFGIFYYWPAIQISATHGFCYGSNLVTETQDRSQMNNVLHILENEKITDSIFSPIDTLLAKKIKQRCE